MDVKALKIIEQNHLGHFVYLPKQLGFDTEEINGVTVINCGFKSSMFNIAYGSLESVKISDSINEIKKSFARQPFAWWVPPTDHKQEFTDNLLRLGFVVEAPEHAMICDVEENINLQRKTNLEIKSVTNKLLLDDFLTVLEVYDSCVNEFYNRIDERLLAKNEKLFVGYERDIPVTIGILFCSKESAGIFSLITDTPYRRKGYGSDMMTFLMESAKKLGCKTITLSASSDSATLIYERLGFRSIGRFECFEYKGDI